MCSHGDNNAMSNLNNSGHGRNLQYKSTGNIAFNKTGGAGTHETTNIAAAVPVEAVLVEIMCNGYTVTVWGCRKTGSGLDRTNNAASGTQTTECSGQQVDLYNPAAGTSYYNVIGYWS